MPSPKLTAIDLGPAVPVVVKLSAPAALVRVPAAISVMSDLVPVASVKRTVLVPLAATVNARVAVPAVNVPPAFAVKLRAVF